MTQSDLHQFPGVPQDVAPPAPAAPRAPAWQRQPLFVEQYWFVRLRWVAGAVVLIGGLANWQYLHWYRHGPAIALVGAAILAYNAVLLALMRPRRQEPWPLWQLKALAWTQILLDLACLTCLTVWTGGYSSPLRPLYLFHMVFASILLPRLMAFGTAMVAILMLEAALGFTSERSTTPELQIALAWALSLLGIVYLASHITRGLRQQRRWLVRKNQRIRGMSRRLRRQERLMGQQEKMVAMGQMAAGVAHEIGNPLASLDGLLQLLERKPEKMSPEQIARLREQVARINGIVRQLTTFAHPGEGAWQSANLNEVITRALEVIRFDRRLKGVLVEKSLDPAVPDMLMIPSALEQVIINLVINALDAMDNAASKQLTLRTHWVAAGGAAGGATGGTAGAGKVGECRFEVTDTGHGIAPEHRRRLFEPFFTTKPVSKGTGLGLSISYSLVRKHGGAITVASEPGKGTTFTVHLPLSGDRGARGPEPVALPYMGVGHW